MEPVGMEAFITALLTTVNSAAMWGELKGAVAFVSFLIIFGFGYRVLRKLVSGASKGKARI